MKGYVLGVLIETFASVSRAERDEHSGDCDR